MHQQAVAITQQDDALCVLMADTEIQCSKFGARSVRHLPRAALVFLSKAAVVQRVGPAPVVLLVSILATTAAWTAQCVAPQANIDMAAVE